MKILIKCLLIIPWLIQIISAANYLFYLPFSSKSIKIGFMPMAKELAQRGHKIYVVSPYKEKKPIVNIEDIVHDSPMEEYFKRDSEMILEKNTGTVTDMPWQDMFATALESNRQALLSPELQKILFDDSIKIDVVMSLPFFSSEAGAWVAHKKNASFVHFMSIQVLLPWTALATGSLINPAYMQVGFLPYSQHMNFKERLINTFSTMVMILGRKFYIIPKLEQSLKSIFPYENITDLYTLCDDVSLTINMGSPFTGDGLRPVMPNVVRGGLMTCKPEYVSPLEGELKKWVEGAEHGVIFVSFGSLIKASLMPEDRRKMFLSVFAKLKQRVIWKWEKDMPDTPENVKLFPWLPQVDLLEHRNVKLFITHGGAGSVQETICHKKPVVGIPIQSDQFNNLAEAERHRIGLVIPWADVTHDNLLQAINQVIQDSSYQERVEKLQNLILDTPIHPLDNTVWWLEYLIRHPHNKKMRSPGKELYWFQYYLLDVIGSLCVLLYLVCKILQVISRLLIGVFKKKKEKIN